MSHEQARLDQNYRCHDHHHSTGDILQLIHPLPRCRRRRGRCMGRGMSSISLSSYVGSSSASSCTYNQLSGTSIISTVPNEKWGLAVCCIFFILSRCFSPSRHALHRRAFNCCKNNSSLNSLLASHPILVSIPARLPPLSAAEGKVLDVFFDRAVH